MADNWYYSQNMRGFMRLLVPQLTKDVTFVCDEGKCKLNASMAVLAACSKFFSNLWDTCEHLEPLVIAVPEASTAELICLFNFVYYGVIEDVNQENVNQENLKNLSRRLMIHGFAECFDEYLMATAKAKLNGESHNGISTEQAQFTPLEREAKIEIKSLASVEELSYKLGIEVQGKNLVLTDYAIMTDIFGGLDVTRIELALLKHSNKPLSVIRRREAKLGTCRFSDADLTTSQKDLLQILDQSIYEVLENKRESYTMECQINSQPITASADSKIKAVNSTILLALKFIADQASSQFQKPPSESLLVRLRKIFDNMEACTSKDARKWGKLNIAARYDRYEELLTAQEKANLIRLDTLIKLQNVSGIHGRESFEMSIELDPLTKVAEIANTKLKAANLAILAAIRTISSRPDLKGKWPALSREDPTEGKPMVHRKTEGSKPSKKKSCKPKINPEWIIRLRKLLVMLENRGKTFKSESPFEILKTIIPEAIIDFFSSDGKGGTVNNCVITINGQVFRATERTKMATKHAVSKTILKKFFNLKFELPATKPQLNGLNETGDTFGNAMENLVLAKFNELLSDAKEMAPYMAYKALAGVVVTLDENLSTAKVISIGTGSKFLHATHIKTNGEALIDCHAEVIARRGLLLFIYNEVITQSNEIFVMNSGDADAGGKFVLRPGVRFHFYASTAPCGDGRIFSHAAEPVKSKKLGFLRTKGECLRTTKVVDYEKILLDKKEIHIMSCSDKLMKWNILGVQGALLAQFVERIRFSTISIGEKMHVENIKRAVIDRITTENFPDVHIPEFHAITNSQAQQSNNSNLYSINWNIATNQLEAVNATTGLTLSVLKPSTKSQLSKRSMLGFFTKLKAAQCWQSDGPLCYIAAKLGSTAYNEERDKFMELISQMNLGVWLKKSSVMEDFKLKNVDKGERKYNLHEENKV